MYVCMYIYIYKTKVLPELYPIPQYINIYRETIHLPSCPAAPAALLSPGLAPRQARPVPPSTCRLQKSKPTVGEKKGFTVALLSLFTDGFP